MGRINRAYSVHDMSKAAFMGRLAPSLRRLRGDSGIDANDILALSAMGMPEYRPYARMLASPMPKVCAWVSGRHRSPVPTRAKNRNAAPQSSTTRSCRNRAPVIDPLHRPPLPENPRDLRPKKSLKTRESILDAPRGSTVTQEVAGSNPVSHPTPNPVKPSVWRGFIVSRETP